ncbi:MAG TPA: NADAR family protein [Puia sp.]
MNIIFNKNWLTQKYTDPKNIPFLFFWGHQPSKDGSTTKSCFSQWWVAPFEADGLTYQTAEHWMMAGKARFFGDEAALEVILASETPAKAKEGGRLVRNFDPAIWDEHKFDIVVNGNVRKFAAYPELKTFLLNTGDQVLVEASPRDRIWGIGMPGENPAARDPALWRGENLLGFALMEVRDKFKGK